MRKKIILPALALLLALGACAPAGEPAQGSESVESGLGYTQITQEEAKERMALDDGHLIVDVRRQDEYDQGHIPGAICVPNESIGCDAPEALPDYDQILLVYCRSGRRSKEAAQKLSSMGYTRVYEFGGILDWTGDVTSAPTPAPAVLTFSSFDGGGPEYTLEAEDPDLVSWETRRDYGADDPEEVDGAAYDLVCTFTGLRPGETTLTVRARSPIAENCDALYTVTVDETLAVTLTPLSVTDPEGQN